MNFYYGISIYYLFYCVIVPLTFLVSAPPFCPKNPSSALRLCISKANVQLVFSGATISLSGCLRLTSAAMSIQYDLEVRRTGLWSGYFPVDVTVLENFLV